MNNLRKIAEICNTSADFSGKIFFDEPMAAHTTFKIGGPADLFIEPADEKSLMFVLNELHTLKLPFFILGGGSNLVVSDKGIEGCVLAAGALKGISFDGYCLHCAAGTSFDELLDFCRLHSLGGLENFAGLPGSVGGAVYMNARCYEKSISEVLAGADYLCPTKAPDKKHYSINENDWEYKKSPFMDMCASGSPPLILSASFKVYRETPALIAQKCAEHIQDRERKGHFRYPSAGSVFKNNRTFGKPSGQIIDEAGLRAFRIGDAQVAPWHGNFIVNLGNASADNIKELVEQIQREVKRKTDFDLECEIIFYGK